MKKILATLMLIGTSSAFTAQAQLWNHNGSTMSVNISNDQIKIYYAQPRKVMLDAGAKPNDLLFEGTINGNIVVGVAKIFAHHCGQFTYQVAGSINANKSEINLNGQAPVVDRSTCKQTRLVPDALAFNTLPNNSNTDTSANPSGQNQTLPNQYVGKLDGNWYSSQWKYGYTLKEGVGVATSTNSPNFQVGQTIIQLTATSPTTFTGQQVYTDGRFYKVNVTLQADGSLYFEGEKNAKWTMSRVQSGSVATVTESQSRSAPPTAIETVRSAADMKPGFSYDFYKGGKCTAKNNTLCLTATEYKQACSLAKGVTQQSLKVRAVFADTKEKVLLEGGNFENIRVIWGTSMSGTEQCYAIITASGIVEGNSARAEIQGVVSSFIKNSKGEILVSHWSLW